MAWDTAANIINDAAVECGLEVSANPFISTDPNFIQLCRLLKIVGRDLRRDAEWSQLRMEHTLLTVIGLSEYDLPDDYDRMIDQTGWQRTPGQPLGGPLSAQVWQSLVATDSGVNYSMSFRFTNRKVYLYPTPTVANQEIVYEYQSAWWVQPASENDPTLDAPTASTDIIWYDPALITQELRLRFLQAKNLPAADAQRARDKVRGQAIGADRPGSKVSMNTQVSGDRFLDDRNIPTTGFGS